MGEPSVRDALIAEILGDIGKLHDAVGTLTNTLSNQVEETQKQTAQTVDFLRVAGDDFLKKIRLANSVFESKNDSNPSHFELFKNIHEQWAIDARSIGDSMNSAQEKIDASLVKLSLQEQRVIPLQLHQPRAPVVTKHEIKKSSTGFVVSLAAAVLLTSACFVAWYYLSGMDKTTQLGAALTRDWMKLDVTTRTKISDTIKTR
jgi:hypothetical protein